MLVVFNINNITTLGLANNTSLTLSSWISTLTLVFNTKLQLQPPNQQTNGFGWFQLLGTTHIESFLAFRTFKDEKPRLLNENKSNFGQI